MARHGTLNETVSGVSRTKAESRIDAFRLTAPELLLLKSLAMVERSRATEGLCSPKSWMVSRVAGKGSSWCAATAGRRISERAPWPVCIPLVHQSPNGHIWMLAAGWALILAMEAA